MFCSKTSLFLKSLNVTIRNYSNLANEHFFTKILELPDITATQKLLRNCEYLLSLNKEDVQNSVNFLMNIGVTVEDICKQPKILLFKDITLRNRYEILLECGCPKVSATILKRYVHLSHQTEDMLKKQKIIPKDTNLQERLAEILNVKLHTPIENTSLQRIRWHILGLFYFQNNIMTNEEYAKVTRMYPNGNHKSYRAMKEVLELMLGQVKISKEKIKNNFFVMHSNPDNIRKLLTIQYIGGIEITEMLRLHPKIIMTSYESIQKTLAFVKDFGMTEESVTKCFRVLSLRPETVYERLMELNKIKELQVMTEHPRILNLILQKPMTAARMEYLKMLNFKCYSLNTLTCSVGNFERYSSQGANKTKIKDCLKFLAKTFNKDKSLIKNQISRHSHWLHISIVDMKETINQLNEAGFDLEIICLNIHIVLYSPKLILSQLQKLNETEKFQGINTKKLTKPAQLKLILYLIEFDYRFNGDGVWVDRMPTERSAKPNEPGSFSSFRLKNRVRSDMVNS